MDSAKLVVKPWGHELWISDAVGRPYALKKILFHANNKTSLQVHKFKTETNYVLSGSGILLLSDKFFDVDKYTEGKMTSDEIADHIDSMKQIELLPEVIFHVTPGHLHRVIAITDLTFIEASSAELDDVIRLQDDTNRAHGKIDSEHR